MITGINTGDFGKTTGERFFDLLVALDAVEGIERYRISSIEPNLLTDEILEFSKTSRKFQPHFHIPLQSGCDRILGLMRRRYTTAVFADRVAAARRVMPDVFLGIDVIVGFPGETEDDFQHTYNFLNELAPAFLHIFPYSVRPNTPAAEMLEKISPQDAERRVKALSELSDTLHRQFVEKQIGTTQNVLFESTRKGGKMFGYTENYVKVETDYDRTLINAIKTVELTEVTEEGNAKCRIL